MKNSLKIILPILIFFIVFLMIASSSSGNSSTFQMEQPSTSSTGGNHVILSTTYTSPYQDFYVPANSTGMYAFPDWHIYLYGTGNFTMAVNSAIVESGYSVGAFNFTYTLNVGGGTLVNATIMFNSVAYTYHDVYITGPVSDKQVCTVTVESTCKDNPQQLSVSSGQTGELMYPHWNVAMQTTQNETYTVYLDGAQIFSGNVDGAKTLQFNVTGNSTTVLIGLGSHVFKYNNELIARVSLNKYYAPAPPTLAYTFAEYEMGILKAFIASGITLLVGLLTAKKYTLEKEKREVVRV